MLEIDFFGLCRGRAWGLIIVIGSSNFHKKYEKKISQLEITIRHKKSGYIQKKSSLFDVNSSRDI